MARHNGTPKTCNRCGRSGSHAFRRTPDGLFECTTTTACRARARRMAGARQDGRGRLPKQRGFTAAGPGVAYVIGHDGPERELVGQTLRELTELAVALGEPGKMTLSALGSRNVKLIALAGDCLESVGFRNELALRRRQPRLSGVPVFLYGGKADLASALQRMPDARPISFVSSPMEIGRRLRAEIRAFETDGAPSDLRAS